MPTFPQDIRWKQRLQNFEMAYTQFQQAVALANARALTDLEKQGLIQSFEYTHELAWNVMKDYFEYQGAVNIRGSRDAIREAFQKNLIADGDSWMEMIRSRNQTTHTYNKSVAEEIINNILFRYATAFSQFLKTMKELDQNG